MSPPTSLMDLSNVAIANSLTKANTTASSHPAKAIDDSHLAPLDPTLLQTHLTTSPKPFSHPREWGLADVTTDHMLTARWTSSSGWSAPQIRPYARLDLFPTASCLHYATECFEGLKAYRGVDGRLRLFRPSRNASRMLMSSMRIACPTFPPSALESLISSLLSTDGAKWCPEPGDFLYVRPTMIGTGRALGVQKPREAMLFIVCTLFPKLDKPMKLLASAEDAIRAWPGGFGFAKVGANYGPSLMAQKEAQRRGYDQILWLFGKEGYVTEAGASNFFVVLERADGGGRELVTAPLDDKIILDGVTRRSIIELARERLKGEVHVVERRYTAAEMVQSWREGRLVEAFAAGTAFFVAPVVGVHFRGVDVELREVEGGVMERVKGWLRGIMYGEEEHEWAVVIPEKKVTLEECAGEEVDEIKEEIRRLMAKKGWLRAMEEVKTELEV